MAKRRGSRKVKRRVRKEKPLVSKYDKPFYKIVPTAIFGITGLGYLLTPYDILVKLGLDFGETHEGHITFAVVFLGIAAIFWYVNNRKRE